MSWRLGNAASRLISQPATTHRVIQSCWTVCLCSALIIIAFFTHPTDRLSLTIVEWAFSVLLATVVVFHTSSVVSSRLNRDDRRDRAGGPGQHQDHLP